MSIEIINNTPVIEVDANPNIAITAQGTTGPVPQVTNVNEAEPNVITVDYNQPIVEVIGNSLIAVATQGPAGVPGDDGPPGPEGPPGEGVAAGGTTGEVLVKASLLDYHTEWCGNIAVSGTVTANAGTDLNTSLLALDTSVNGILLAQNSTTSGQTGPLLQGATTTSAPTYTTAKTNPLSLTTAGALRVDGSAVTQPVSGTVAVSSVGGTVTTSGTATVSGTVAVSGVGGTTAISAASLPLPSGAAIAIKQPALGTAGSASSDVITVQGIASMTALKVDGSAVTQPVNGTVAVSSVGGTVTVDGSGVTQPVSGTVAISGTTAISAAALPLPSGASTAAKQPALGTAGTASADVITVQGVASMTALKVDGSAVTQPVSGTVAVSSVGGTVTTSGTATVSGTVAVSSVGGTVTTSGTATVSGTVAVSSVGGTTAISAASLPLPSGAATEVKQPALGTAGTASTDVITVQGIASMTALKVDGSAVTQPVSGTVAVSSVGGTTAVSAASLPLPSGASTAAKQPALGTAGTASADVITVQGITSMTALKVDGSAVTQPISGTVAVTQVGGTIQNNQRSIAASATQISTSSVALTYGMLIKAALSNTALVYVGASGVTTSTGYELSAGENVSIPINNANLAYAISASGTQTVSWIGI